MGQYLGFNACQEVLVCVAMVNKLVGILLQKYDVRT